MKATQAVLNSICVFLTNSSISSKMTRLTETCGRTQQIKAAHKVGQAVDVRSREANIMLTGRREGAGVGWVAAFERLPADNFIRHATLQGLLWGLHFANFYWHSSA